MGTGSPWASGQQVHGPRGSCALPVQKKRNQICRLLTSGPLPTLPMFQGSWGASAANVRVPWPRDIARMPDAQAGFEIASGWVKKKKCKLAWHVHIGQNFDLSFWVVLVNEGQCGWVRGLFGQTSRNFLHFLKMFFHQIWVVIYGPQASSTGLRPAN